MAEVTETTKQDATPAGEGQAQVRWNTANLKSSYANVCNATSTREEVVLNFGVNEGWERTQKEMEIDLTHRTSLAPLPPRGWWICSIS